MVLSPHRLLAVVSLTLNSAERGDVDESSDGSRTNGFRPNLAFYRGDYPQQSRPPADIGGLWQWLYLYNRGEVRPRHFHVAVDEQTSYSSVRMYRIYVCRATVQTRNLGQHNLATDGVQLSIKRVC